MKNTPALSTATGVSKDQISSIDFTAPVVPVSLPFLSRKEQHAIVLSALRRGPKTTSELRTLGCFMASTRVFELKAFGFEISRTLVTAWASDGRPHPRMALYELHEPKDAWVRPASGGN